MLSAYAWTTLVFWIAAFTWLGIRGRVAQQNVRVYGQSPGLARAFKWLARVCIFVVIYFPHWFRLRATVHSSNRAAGIAGVGLCARGLLLVMFSRRTLGRAWSDLIVVKQDHELVQRGPYKWIRHPLYAGVVLALLSALTVGTGAACAIAAACFVGQLAKSRKEEALLTREVPGYAEYRLRVKAFVPFLF